MSETSALALVAVPSVALQALVGEVASDVGIPVTPVFVDGHRQAGLTITAEDTSLASQAYRLEVAPTADGPTVSIRAGDEAGAYNGLLSLATLIVSDGPTWWLRAAVVDDAPGFTRRGAILDPYVLPDIGVTPASRALLLDRLRFGTRYKLNFVDLPSRTPWPELARFCDDHHLELMVALGYRDVLTTMARPQLKDSLAEQLDAGANSISFNWDDIGTANPVPLAREHAEILLDLYAFIRRRDPGVRVSVVLPPYSGVPGQVRRSMSEDSERYLAVMHDALPADVRVFWTGDSGLFGDAITTEGARAYADAVGHEIGLWDNDAIGFSRGRQPCRGRAADLSTVVHTYMANLAGEADWSGGNGAFALLTSLFYTWNPVAYDPTAAAVAAERVLQGEASDLS